MVNFRAYRKIVTKGDGQFVSTLRGKVVGDRIHRWVSYNRFEEESVPIPPGFVEVRMERETIEKYYCGHKILLRRGNCAYQDLSERMRGMKTHFVHHNGDRPYLIYVGTDECYIFKVPPKSDFAIDDDCADRADGDCADGDCADRTDRTDDRTNYDRTDGDHTDADRIDDRADADHSECWSYLSFVRHFRFKRIFLESSVLIDLGKRYVFVGRMIYEFTCSNRIVRFHSPMGNNGVAYPYAIDRKGNHHLLLETVTIASPPTAECDIYRTYYDLSRISEEFYVDDEPYLLRYESDSDRLYRRFKCIGDNLSIKRGNRRRTLNRKRFARLLSRFAERTGIQPLSVVDVIDIDAVA